THLHIWSRICILLSYISFLYSQDIKLLELEHKHCVTKCASGFINNVDKLVFKSIINFTQPSNEFIFSTYMIKETTTNDYKKLFHIHPSSACMERKDLDYYCEKTGDNIFHVYITLQAEPKYIGAEIKAVLSDANKNEISSDYQIVPETYDARNVTGTITINGENYYNDDCRANISISDLKLEFVCSSPATPCLIEILTDDTQNVAAFKNSAVLKRTLSTQQILFVTLKFAACRLDGAYNNVTCRIQADTDNSPMSIATIAPIIGSVFMLIILLILFIFVIIRFRKYNSQQKFERENIHIREMENLFPHADGEKDNVGHSDKSTLTDIYGLNVVLKCDPISVQHKDVQVDEGAFVNEHVLTDGRTEPIIDLKKER
ncbi:unnamed protein product, partial [Lymnaea stagnalis]